jgi:hypothetical protein
MRRVLSIALMIAFFAPSAAPTLFALTSDPEANLPACCRSHGAHHCAMMHWKLQSLDSGAPKLTQAPCPMYPTVATVPQSAAFPLAAAPRLLVEPVRASASPAVTASRAQLLLARTRGDRGPPAFSS